MNSLSRDVCIWLGKHGCREVVVCAGARNAPLVMCLYGLADSGEMKIWNFPEERSAAFFALGRIKSTGKPVGVLTTSGTAAAELYPAIIEAHYAGLPLIALTADRPRRYRGSGAPQAIEQVGLFANYSQMTMDVASTEDLDSSHWDINGPAHLNICLEEPKREEMLREPWLLGLGSTEVELKGNPSALNLIAAERFFSLSTAPAIVVSALSQASVPVVKKHLLRLGLPVYLESLSGLSGDPDLFSLRIWGGERSLAVALERGWCNGIIRIGGVPTARFWRDLEGKFQSTPVLNVCDQPFSGLSRVSQAAVPLSILGQISSLDIKANPHWRQWQLNARQHIDALLDRFPNSEPGMLARLAYQLPSELRLYLGNSLPVREWELARGRREQNWWIEGNRGVNGIDGQVSTFLGFADAKSANWAILGDLTAIYDLAAPWVLRQCEFQDLNIVVVNNGGGRIFKRMYEREELENSHAIEFSGWAKMWNMQYERWSDIPTSLGSGGRGRIIELIPDENMSDGFWQEWEVLWRELFAQS